MVRVLVGEYCKGKPDALTPDVRQGNQLYDSTVDDVANPSIFVTYNDAQVCGIMPKEPCIRVL
jgi:hypothetical protein